MFNTLWSWVGNHFWPAFRDTFWNIAAWAIDKISHILSFHFLAIAALLNLVFLIIAATWWALQELAVLMASVDLDQFKAGSTSLLQYGAFIDRFIPLHEGLAGAVLLFDFWLVITTFRWIKSFIPFWSN